ncbi:MAG: DUF481 domain-containing protein [Acidobacteria bacterium]|nr:DUF481 domain-containing protein [Acidobacteriota bacterium]MYA45932.1 DUF481 domain-containing protein [Acidobacteriota bacterium]MYB33228.1 DUF481 domain-containing protein [Acidobacteriota bacterium]MYH21585.1 DUF481 domain-containing protein [Acidobacteriota bacterium]MYI38396.1 DUF481 domain-containing protein [Acidobacteriota bacterium]
MRTCARRHRILRFVLALPMLAHVPPALAQTASAPARDRWTGQANLNLAGSYGNAGSGSLGVSAAAARQAGWLRVALEGGLLRTSTDTVTREAFGSPDAFSVRRTVESQTSADRTHLRARFSEPSPEDGDTSPRFFAAAGWERDAPAGVRSRFDLTVGMGTAWGRTQAGGRRPFETSLGLSAIHQSDQVTDPDVETASLGLRFDVRAQARYRAADLTLVSASTWNLRNTDDLRLDVIGSAALPLSQRLAFRTSVQTLFDSRPSLERLSLFPVPGEPPVGTVVASRRRTDLIVLASLVVRF